MVGKEQVASLTVRKLAFLRAWLSWLIVNFSICEGESFLTARVFVRSFYDLVLYYLIKDPKQSIYTLPFRRTQRLSLPFSGNH